MTLLIATFVSLNYAMPLETEYTGNVAVSGYNDDEVWGTFPIGFSFDFFGNTYTDFFVNSNGLVMFGEGGPHFNNRDIPNPGGINNFIAPFWDDIVIHSSGDIMYQTIGTAPNRKLVIQFYNMSFWNSPVLLGTFQVILYEGSNNIQVQYRTIVEETSDMASGGSATVGLEDAEGKSGVRCSFNTPGYVRSGKAILFTPADTIYTYDDLAVYEGIFLQTEVPRAGAPVLISPANLSSVGDYVTFQWEAAANASSYYVVISQNPDLSNPIHSSGDLTDLVYEYPLSADQSYYWSIYAKNISGAESWSEIWSFQTKTSAPLVAVPKSSSLEQGDQRILTLMFTGGDAGSKTATITTLPLEGTLFQYEDGAVGLPISSVPTDLTDPSFKVIYQANGATGTGVGTFDFEFSDLTWNSATASYTIHVSPPGIPNFLYASKETDRVEITFDRPMADPTGKYLEFSIQDDGVDVSPTSCQLKTGDPTTIIVFVTPGLNTDHAISVAYTKGSVVAESNGLLESFDFQLAGKLAQVINFGALTDKTFGDPDFALSSTASSGLPVSFSSSNSTVVSVSGSTALITNSGETLIYASQAGDSTYAPVVYERHQLVNKAVAEVSLSNLSQGYTGNGLQVTVTTVPAGLSYKASYNGSIILPVDPGSYTVSVLISDLNYLGSAMGTLSIIDVGAPVPDVAILPDLIGECSLSPTAPTATDDISGVITGTTNTPFPISSQGTTLVTWSYVDDQGNSTSQTQTVILNDVTAPDIPTLSDITGDCYVEVDSPSTTDACVGIIVGTTPDPLSYTTQGIHVITWTFDDGNGNSIQVTQNVVVLPDQTPPLAPVLPNVIGECSATATVPTTTDACEGTITGTTSDPLNYSEQGIHPITWNFDDGNGNSIDVIQNVVISDLSPPTATCPGDALICENTGLKIALQDVSDNCSLPQVSYVLSGATSGSGSGDASVETFNPGVTTVTYTLSDESGNSNQCVFTVTSEKLVDVLVKEDAGTLSVETAGTYQWINCQDASPIEGQTGSSFTPGVNGDYAVIVSRGACSLTSDCYTVDYTGIEKKRTDVGVDVYPNPASHSLTIEMEHENTNVTLRVMNTMGQLVLVEEVDKLDKTRLDVSRFNPGIYLIAIKSDQLDKIIRIVKE